MNFDGNSKKLVCSAACLLQIIMNIFFILNLCDLRTRDFDKWLRGITINSSINLNIFFGISVTDFHVIDLIKYNF